MTEHLCYLHEDDEPEHWTNDVVGVIPALKHLDGSWDPMGDPVPADRECANSLAEADRVVVWQVAS